MTCAWVFLQHQATVCTTWKLQQGVRNIWKFVGNFLNHKQVIFDKTQNWTQQNILWKQKDEKKLHFWILDNVVYSILGQCVHFNIANEWDKILVSDILFPHISNRKKRNNKQQQLCFHGYLRIGDADGGDKHRWNMNTPQTNDLVAWGEPMSTGASKTLQHMKGKCIRNL